MNHMTKTLDSEQLLAPQEERMFRAAASFEHSSQVLIESVARTQAIAIAMRGHEITSCTIGQEPPGLIPMVVCISFSAELYLKCLIQIETGSAAPRIHTLSKLFEMLSPLSKERSKRYYEH